MKKVPSVLTIAGTDPTGGAGIHADLKTFQECTAYGMAVVTSVVAQNTEGVRNYVNVSLEMLEEQIEAVFDDIYPDAVKTGMIATPEMIEKIASLLEKEDVPLVVDPVMVATSGDSLMEKETVQLMKERLLPLATIATPNISEAEILIGKSIRSLKEAEEAAQQIVEETKVKATIVKGGHLTEEATDILYTDGKWERFSAPRTETKHTHGTGCTFSAAIAAKLARGRSIEEAVSESKTFITNAIAETLAIGKGNGPVNHWASRLKKSDIVVENARQLEG
ncbi:bifunctional hydroxymethylpyrimidine kinase/phosphomethylpyrimidine kinase [Aliibacillus thermotolerans]|uniref:Hydroxymethylpyrimidine/phosphomethylpyrimidine kinase n=1 Tax=Aliibacillus thermotolerans TaxID=1834418 RepID=A0ABW0U9G2_9BACI|nr:bifunctional hydroxymethylpyrimidine kinase/phosphomethylpyrimidine kinase [Aliibacillus thermotolerans]MDA3129560.1 bifunctional hydroxymethylpyrimidine kinase/phosphomethylpyrimidine kinase [Aliibacillus thermotolerans]